MVEFVASAIADLAKDDVSFSMRTLKERSIVSQVDKTNCCETFLLVARGAEKKRSNKRYSGKLKNGLKILKKNH